MTVLSQRCYWNASIVSQTWGGEVVHGYIVDELDSTGINFGGTIRLLGHEFEESRGSVS